MQARSTETMTTAALAALLHVRPGSVRTSHWRHGHYAGVKPLKTPTGRLLWPADEVLRAVFGEGGRHDC
jgi:hypothetical protein